MSDVRYEPVPFRVTRLKENAEAPNAFRFICLPTGATWLGPSHSLGDAVSITCDGLDVGQTGTVTLATKDEYE